MKVTLHLCYSDESLDQEVVLENVDLIEIETGGAKYQLDNFTTQTNHWRTQIPRDENEYESYIAVLNNEHCIEIGPDSVSVVQN